ncbi:hypothetical protein MBRA1_001348 [Malassezia brasiliensis]|uniref:PX domain-containing protein n=1 Tax=Malassezia brasiliensis TaxID=1821822 RepID=A0AAF0DS49_9BASI|nr:hypothetical protein MBRA1_001348 [Malassezia brasiliensis]
MTTTYDWDDAAHSAWNDAAPRAHDTHDATERSSGSSPPPAPQARADAAAPARIHITDAVVSTERAAVGYIAYVIDTPDAQVKRRYSEFEALRNALVALHPTLIVPPIPSKHSLSDYALKQTKAKDDPAIIAHRKRTLERFLNRCDAHPVLREDPVWVRFLDPRFSWHEIQTSPPLSQLPKSNLNAPPRCPADPKAPLSYRALPTPTTVRKLREPNERFAESEAFTTRFEAQMAGRIEPAERRLVRRWHDVGADYAELGALFNAQSLAESPLLAPAVERVGQAADATYMAYQDMLARWERQVSEPLHEYTQYAKILQATLQWRHLKHQQLELAHDDLAAKRQQLADLEHVEAEYARLSSAMEIGGGGLDARRPTAPAAPPPTHASVYGRAAEEAEGGASPRAASAPVLPAARALPPPRRKGMLGSLSQALQNMMDVDPDKTRQNTISRLREDVMLLSEGVQLAERDLQEATDTIQASLDRFQRLKVADVRQLLLDAARTQRDLCRDNVAAWQRACAELDRTPAEAFGGMPSAHLAPPAATAPSAAAGAWSVDD